MSNFCVDIFKKKIIISSCLLTELVYFYAFGYKHYHSNPLGLSNIREV